MHLEENSGFSDIQTFIVRTTQHCARQSDQDTHQGFTHLPFDGEFDGMIAHMEHTNSKRSPATIRSLQHAQLSVMRMLWPDVDHAVGHPDKLVLIKV